MALPNFWKTIRQRANNQATKNKGAAGSAQKPIRMSGTVVKTLGSKPHPSDAITEQTATGCTGNDWVTPTRQRFVEGADNERYQDIANSHLSEGPTPGRIPRPYNDRMLGRLGKGHTPDGNIGLLLNITGVSAGGQGDAMYIPHTSILRPAGKSLGSLRTIDDGAQIPGVYLADPTRR
jgi:hypothetical protein